MIVESSDGIRLSSFPIRTDYGELVFDESKIIMLHDFACMPCNTDIDYRKIQNIFNYIALRTEANCTREYKERVLCLFIPFDDKGVLKFDSSKCSSFRFMKTQEWLDKYVINYPELLLRTKLFPLEQLELASLFIINKEYTYLDSKIV